MPILALKPDDEALRVIRSGELVHLSQMDHFDHGICQRKLEVIGGELVCEVHLKATVAEGLYGHYKNLSVIDFERLKGARTSYVYYFLGEPKRLQRFLNTDNLALFRGGPKAREIQIKVKGEDVYKACGGRLFYRPIDQSVIAFGDFRGLARVRPVPL